MTDDGDDGEIPIWGHRPESDVALAKLFLDRLTFFLDEILVECIGDRALVDAIFASSSIINGSDNKAELLKHVGIFAGEIGDDLVKLFCLLMDIAKMPANASFGSVGNSRRIRSLGRARALNKKKKEKVPDDAARFERVFSEFLRSNLKNSRDYLRLSVHDYFRVFEKTLDHLRKTRSELHSEPASYAGIVQRYDIVSKVCLYVSFKNGGRPSTGPRDYWASVLLAQFCGLLISIATLVPESKASRADSDHWNYTAVASLVRAALDCYLVMLYISIEDVPENVRRLRMGVMRLHDCISRVQFFSGPNKDIKLTKRFARYRIVLSRALIGNADFALLSEKSKKHILNGHSLFMEPQDAILSRVGIDGAKYRWMYRVLSSHVHSLPLSFYRFGEGGRGLGEGAEVEKSYIAMFLSFLSDYMARAATEVANLPQPN